MRFKLTQTADGAARLVRLPTFTTTATFTVNNGGPQTLTFTGQARSEYSHEQMAAHGVKALHPDCRITAITTTN